MASGNASDGVVRGTFAILLLVLLTGGTLWILLPFFSAAAWASMTVIATWPLLLRLEETLGSRGRAVAVLVTAFLALLILPVAFGVVTVVESADLVANQMHAILAEGLPPSPEWIESIPLIGPKVASSWNGIAAAGSEGVSAYLAGHASQLFIGFTSQLGSIGMLLLQLLLTIVIAGVMYSSGEHAARGVVLFGRKVAGEDGEQALLLAAQAIRGIALGVVGTAIIQTALAALGLFAAGIPAAAILTFVIFLLCIAQIGPALVLLPAAAYLFMSDQNTAGTIFLIYSIGVCVLDNFLRPVLIRKGVDLPFLLILSGVIGGLLAFGVIGIFIGPVLLAVSFTLVTNWVKRRDEPAPSL